ncbi:MAG: hypothetical protein JWQ27_2100 [Ferruginibacter sp.]|nr:hypothetical protein [Ferruginibacter sp.]
MRSVIGQPVFLLAPQLETTTVRPSINNAIKNNLFMG